MISFTAIKDPKVLHGYEMRIMVRGELLEARLIWETNDTWRVTRQQNGVICRSDPVKIRYFVDAKNLVRDWVDSAKSNNGG